MESTEEFLKKFIEGFQISEGILRNISGRILKRIPEEIHREAPGLIAGEISEGILMEFLTECQE